MNIIVVGCGRVGASLAVVLDTPENEVSIVDIDPSSFARLNGEFEGRKVVGQGFDEDVLFAWGIEDCDAFAAVTSQDNVNLMASEVARRLYKVPHVNARTSSTPSGSTCMGGSVWDHVCDTELVAENMAAKILAGRAHHIDVFGDYEVLTFVLSLENSGVVHVRDIEALGDIHISLFEHDDETYVANPSMFLHDGDTVLAVARGNSLLELASYMKS